MERRRLWLVLLSIVSLVVLVYAGVFAAYSVTVTPQMEHLERLPNATEPRAGTRALTLPISDVTQVPTFQKGGGQWNGVNGTLILAGDPNPTFPAVTSNASIARALAYVTPTANGTYVPDTITFIGLPHRGDAAAANASVNISALANGKAGFIVRADNDDNITFVAVENVIGTIARFDPAPALVSLFAFGAFGFVAPIIMLVVTHRGIGKRGVAGAPGMIGLCPECRRPLPPKADFCTACGAWLKGR